MADGLGALVGYGGTEAYYQEDFGLRTATAREGWEKETVSGDEWVWTNAWEAPFGIPLPSGCAVACISADKQCLQAPRCRNHSTIT